MKKKGPHASGNSLKQRFVNLSFKFKLVMAVVLLASFWFGYKEYQSIQNSKVLYQTAKAEKGTLVISVSASGSVSASNLESITTQASGIVKKIYVKDGDKVTKGQKIAEIDLDQEGLQQKASAYASYISAVNSLDSANNSYRSTQASLQNIYDQIKGHDNDETLTMKETRTKGEVANDNAYKAIQSAQVKVASAWDDYALSSPVITSPSSGTISSLTIAEGFSLGSQTSTSGTRTGQRVASIVKEGNPIVSVNLSEIDVPDIKVGQKSSLTFDSLSVQAGTSAKTFSGEVVAVDRVGSTSSNVTSYPALIKLDSGSNLILPNMAVTANIITNVKEGVLLVPSTAISQQSGQMVVKILKNGVLESVNVEVGESSDSQTEIISGINEGEEIITSSTPSSSGTGTTETRSVFSSGFGGAHFGR